MLLSRRSFRSSAYASDAQRGSSVQSEFPTRCQFATETLSLIATAKLRSTIPRLVVLSVVPQAGAAAVRLLLLTGVGDTMRALYAHERQLHSVETQAATAKAPWK